MRRKAVACRRAWVIITLREARSPKVDHYCRVSIADAARWWRQSVRPPRVKWPLPASRLKVEAITGATIYLLSVRGDPLESLRWDVALQAPGTGMEMQPLFPLLSPFSSFDNITGILVTDWCVVYVSLISFSHPSFNRQPLSFHCTADICSVRPNHFTLPQGKQSSNNFKPPSRKSCINHEASLPSHKTSFLLSELPDPLNNCYSTEELFPSLFWIQASHCSARRFLLVFMM